MTKIEGSLRGPALLQNFTLEGIGCAKLVARKIAAQHDLHSIGLPCESWITKACKMSEAGLASHLENLVCHEGSWHIMVGPSIGNVNLWRVGGVALCSSAQWAARFSFDGSLHRSTAAYHYLMLHDAQIFSLHRIARSITRLCSNRPIPTACDGLNTCGHPP